MVKKIKINRVNDTIADSFSYIPLLGLKGVGSINVPRVNIKRAPKAKADLSNAIYGKYIV